ncbi:MAG: hypothetical protein MZU95_15730 [Desulfomicrobium escambiense]|nr:hypothetical protein [Desulfomicrobium escambiense]
MSPSTGRRHNLPGVFRRLFRLGNRLHLPFDLPRIQNLREQYRQGRIVEKLAREPEVLPVHDPDGEQRGGHPGLRAGPSEYTLERWGDWALGAVSCTGSSALAVLISRGGYTQAPGHRPATSSSRSTRPGSSWSCPTSSAPRWGS